MTLGNKTLDDLLTPISEQLGHLRVPASVEVPEWEFKAVRVTDGKGNTCRKTVCARCIKSGKVTKA